MTHHEPLTAAEVEQVIRQAGEIWPTATKSAGVDAQHVRLQVFGQRELALRWLVVSGPFPDEAMAQVCERACEETARALEDAGLVVTRTGGICNVVGWAVERRAYDVEMQRIAGLHKYHPARMAYLELLERDRRVRDAALPAPASGDG